MEMGTKENGYIQEEWSAPESPIEVLQQLSHEAVRMAGEAWNNAYPVSPITPILAPAPIHRRTRSEVVSSFHRRSNSTSSSFVKWKCQMQRALKWGGGRSFCEDHQYSSFDPEILANQKRQWYQLNSRTSGPEKYKEPTSLFEHFVIAGLSPDAKLQAVEDAYVRRNKWAQETERTEMSDFNTRQHRQPASPTLEPQVLFMYPPGRKLALRLQDLSAFCFPGGIKARILERTPSLSDLNELVYGQEHLRKNDLSFIFSLKVADNATLYGVCLHVQEVVQRPPVIYGASTPLSQSNFGCSSLLLSAARCYCILTRVPFFELHYEMLNSIIAQERLNRITKFVTEMALADSVPSLSMSKNENIDSPEEESAIDWMPSDTGMTLTGAAAGNISDEDALSRWDHSPGSATASDTSDHSQTRDLDKDGSKNVHAFDDCASETSENRSNGARTADDICHSNQSLSDHSQMRDLDDKKVHAFHDCASETSENRSNGAHTPDDICHSNQSLPDHSQTRDLDKDGSKKVHAFDDCASETSENRSNGARTPDDISQSNQSLECLRSFESLFSPARSMVSEEDDEISCNHDEDTKDDMIMEWARENKNDLLQIICGYHSIRLPARGCEIIFQPLEHLQAIEYRRPPVSALGLYEKYHDLKPKDSKEASQVKLKLATAEEAASLSLWSTATICRVLSLESVLALVTGVLLEKQVVVLCPNLGILSAVVLSLIPIIRPFEWQSLFLPILPATMLDFLDAPVPFIVGVQHKQANLKMKTSNLVLVNLLKDQVKSCSLPVLPQRKELISELRPIHSVLSCEDHIAHRHPVYKCNEIQVEAASRFLVVMRRYMESLCSELRLHTITNVQSNDDKVSILLKDSFIDSFPVKDQSFIKLFVETQLFSALSDSRLSSYENE